MAVLKNRLDAIRNHLQWKVHGRENVDLIETAGTDIRSSQKADRALVQQTLRPERIYIIGDTKYVTETPDFTLSEFDKNGKPQFGAGVQRGRESYFMASRTSFMSFPQVFQERVRFVVAVRSEGMRSFYDKNIRKSSLTTVGEVHNLSRHSFTIMTSTFADNGSLLMRSFYRIVVIDPSTRRPREVPEWWYDKYSTDIASDAKGLTVNISTDGFPQNTPYRTTINWSDIDTNGHTTFYAYFNMCDNAAHYFASKRHYPTLTETVLGRGIELMECVYLGESSFNEIIDIFSWERDNKTLVFNVKCKEKSIFRLIFAYFDT